MGHFFTTQILTRRPWTYQLALYLAAGIILVYSPYSSAQKNVPRVPLNEITSHLIEANPNKSGVYILERGEKALLARAWLTDHAEHSINVQYFIWSTDNIGTLATEALLRAAEHGVHVRVIVDDLLINAPDKSLLALAAHPLIEIRIYNPKHSVGTSLLKRVANALFDFRGTNQRMHDKTFIVDNTVAITGGRNMADEYYDYDTEFNFRDRDALVIGPVAADMNENFESFWNNPLTVPVEDLLDYNTYKLSAIEIQDKYHELHQYANNAENFSKTVRQTLNDLPHRFTSLIDELIWDEVRFISDNPGKNDGKQGLKGGGHTTTILITELKKAQNSITIQSPYVVIPEGGIELFRELTNRGVKIRISTNSLASTDNLLAFSGYSKQRKKLLDAGVNIYEYQPEPAINKELIERYHDLKQVSHIFAIHAKTMVIDRETIYIGTFNLDPRSANLNTEVGIIVKNAELADQVESSIEKDIAHDNSWNTRTDNPDSYASLGKRIKIQLLKLLPIKDVL